MKHETQKSKPVPSKSHGVLRNEGIYLFIHKNDVVLGEREYSYFQWSSEATNMQWNFVAELQSCLTEEQYFCHHKKINS